MDASTSPLSARAAGSPPARVPALLAQALASATARQAIRFILGGGVVTAISAGIYLACALRLGLSADLANLVAYLVAVLFGYVIHRFWSFAGHGAGANHLATAARFFAASLTSLALNAGFAFALVDLAGLPKAAPSLTMVFVTPVAVFWINKKWVFRA